MRLASLVILLVAVSAPVQAFEITLDGPDSNLGPSIGSVTTTATATATCDEVYERQVPVPDNPASGNSFLAIDLNITTLAGIQIGGPERLLLDTEPCASDPEGSVSTDPTEYTITADSDVEALVDHEFTFTATLEGGDLGEPTTDDATETVQVDYRGALQMVVDEPIKILSPDTEGRFMFTGTNVGNADTTVRFTLNDAPPNGINIILPSETIIPYDPTGTTNAVELIVTVAVDPEAEGEVRPVADFAINIDAWATQDPDLPAPSIQQPLSIRVQDLKNTPAPTILLVAPTLLALALLARRRA